MTTSIKYRHDTVTEMMQEAERVWAESPYASGSRRSSAMDPSNNSWAGGSYKQAEELHGMGWSEGACRVAKVRAELNDAVDQIVAENASMIAFDVEGSWVDTGRIAVGDPECCGFIENTGSAKVVKIIANICVSAAVNHATMFARGAACCAAVDILESLGHRVELAVAIGMKTGDTKKDVQAVIKTSDQPVDSDRIAYTLCHPAFFRRLMFKVMEAVDMDPCGCIPYAVTADEEGAVVLPELKTGSTPSTADTVKEVIEICKLCGIDLSTEELSL